MVTNPVGFRSGRASLRHWFGVAACHVSHALEQGFHGERFPCRAALNDGAPAPVKVGRSDRMWDGNRNGGTVSPGLSSCMMRRASSLALGQAHGSFGLTGALHQRQARVTTVSLWDEMSA